MLSNKCMHCVPFHGLLVEVGVLVRELPLLQHLYKIKQQLCAILDVS